MYYKHDKKNLRSKYRVLLCFVLISLFFSIITTRPSVKAQVNFGDNPNFDPNAPGAKVIIIAPPGVFTLPESATNFTRVCSFSEAINLILEVTGKNKIEFKEPIIDMCKGGTRENLDKYVQLDKVGEVTVRSDLLPYLKDKSSEITMRNLPFDREPAVEVDGNPATDQDIENKSWDQSKKTLTFSAKHFTTYKAVAASETAVENGMGGKQQSASTNYYRFLVSSVLAIGLVAAGAAGYIVWRRKPHGGL